MTYKISKKIILILGLLLPAGGNVFADDSDDVDIADNADNADEENVTRITVIPKNTITVDVWPTAYSLFLRYRISLLNSLLLFSFLAFIFSFVMLYFPA